MVAIVALLLWQAPHLNSLAPTPLSSRPYAALGMVDLRSSGSNTSVLPMAAKPPTPQMGCYEKEHILGCNLGSGQTVIGA
jgi:hypothetical protein